jgi:hypothetical protein
MVQVQELEKIILETQCVSNKLLGKITIKKDYYSMEELS